jgi:hypothetical protein
VKVEPSVESITNLNYDSDVSSPQEAIPIGCPSQHDSFPDVQNESPASIGPTIPQTSLCS